jgi:hypothetical protein
MKPINEVNRKNATRRFVIIYGMSLITVLLMSYFLFSSPVRILKDDVKTHRVFKSQHEALMHKLNTISLKTSQLFEVGSVNSNSNKGNASLDSGYKTEISRLLVDLKSYSGKETIPQVKEDLNNYLMAYTAVLHFHDNKSEHLPAEVIIGSNVTPTGPTNGKESEEIARLRLSIINLNTEKTKQANEIKRLLGLLDNGNEESINRNWQARLTEIEKERDAFKNDLASRSADLRDKDELIKVLKKEKENLNIELSKKNDLTPSNTVNPEDKSKLYQVVDKAIKKNRHTRKEVLVDFNQILHSVESTYTEKGLLKKKIDEINKLLNGDF